MKFTLLRTGDSDFTEIVEINTLEDLISLQEEYQYELIIQSIGDDITTKIFAETDGRYIEVYDSWRE